MLWVVQYVAPGVIGVVLCGLQCIGLKAASEPEIYGAIRFGAVLENVVFDEFTREVDYDSKCVPCPALPCSCIRAVRTLMRQENIIPLVSCMVVRHRCSLQVHLYSGYMHHGTGSPAIGKCDTTLWHISWTIPWYFSVVCPHSA